MKPFQVKRFDYYKVKDKTREGLKKIEAQYISQAATLAGFQAPMADTLREQARLLGQAAYALRQAARVEWYLKNDKELKD